ncbi:MAG: alpha-amylase [Parcubacteria group bacterium]|nr:alpha-amylase [Parcubacteria group bacterium]
MPSVCLYFQVHQPLRIKKYRVFDIGHDSDYFNEAGENNLNNKRILRKVAEKSYLPANAVLLELLRAFPLFKLSFSFSGMVLAQIQKEAPDVLRSFQMLTNTGRVEVLSETSHHSLAFLYSQEEFRSQVRLHDELIRHLFHQIPRVFRNTELIYNNELAHVVEDLGFLGILAEGADHVLGWRSPTFLHRAKDTTRIKVMLKHYRLSDDIAFRFSSKSWSEYPLTAEKFARWISAHNGNGHVINLFMDYETFGEHQWADTGIFDFLRAFPREVLKHPDNDFVTPSEAIARYPAVGELDIPHFVSWADVERDLSAWRGNPLQHDALAKLYAMEPAVLATRDLALIEDWRRLQASDHFYYMCTKWFADGDVHKYFNPYGSPYEAFIAFMNVINDLQLRVGRANRTGTEALLTLPSYSHS